MTERFDTPIPRACALVLVMIWGACARHQAGPAVPAGPAAESREPAPSSAETGSSHELRASYYSRRFTGRKTASGELYDPDLFTAAHASLPLGTVLRVTRLPGGPSVQVRVNDRCGCTHGRGLDLSEAAARKLDMLRAGVISVRIEVLGRR